MQAMWISAQKVMGLDNGASLAGQPRRLHAVVFKSAVATFCELLHKFVQSTSHGCPLGKVVATGHLLMVFHPCADRSLLVNSLALSYVWFMCSVC